MFCRFLQTYEVKLDKYVHFFWIKFFVTLQLIESCRSCLCYCCGFSKCLLSLCADVLERLQQHPASHGAAFEMQLPPNARRTAAPLVSRSGSHVVRWPSSDAALWGMTSSALWRSAGSWLNVQRVRCGVWEVQTKRKLFLTVHFQQEFIVNRQSGQKAIFIFVLFF